MKLIRALILSIRPACLAAVVSTLNANSLMAVDIDSYDNYEKRHKQFQVVIYDDDALTNKEFEMIRKGLTADKKTRKILYTSFTDKDYLEFFILNKIDGIVSHRADYLVVMEAIEKVSSGEQYYCRHTKGFLFEDIPGYKVKALTAREKEILKLSKEGITNLEIAERLFISNKTLESHKWNIKVKLGLRSVKYLNPCPYSEKNT